MRLDTYLKQTFGEKIYKLALDGGMTCPNRDGTLGTAGCAFCSAGGSGEFAEKRRTSIITQLEEAKKRIAAKTDCSRFIAYYQSYTNTYAPIGYLRELFTETVSYPEVSAISIGTRCDCLSEPVLEMLSEINQIKPVWVELGLQTVHDDIRDAMGCGYSLTQFESAVRALQKQNIAVVVHLILGLPGETKAMMLESVDTVGALGVMGIKLQNLQVLRGTQLGMCYEKEPFLVFEAEEYCQLAAECLRRLPPELVIHRITGDGPRKLLITPEWSTDKKRILNRINQLMKNEAVWK